MAAQRSDSSSDLRLPGLRRRGVLIGTAALLGAIIALTIAVSPFDGDRTGVTTSSMRPASSAAAAHLLTHAACSDGRDNDGDGRTDFGQDRQCGSASDAAEKSAAGARPTTRPACSDGGDNDDDGKTDFPRDRGCSSAADSAERLPSCSDGRDNDDDGRTDVGSDPGCSSADDLVEKEPACSDGRDNDSDGKTDFEQDPGCDSRADRAERPVTAPPKTLNVGPP